MRVYFDQKSVTLAGNFASVLNSEVSARRELTVLLRLIKIFPFNVKTCSTIENLAGLLKQKHIRKI